MRVTQLLLAIAAATALLSASAARSQDDGDDVLYIGDGGSNTIKSFHAATGAAMGESDGPGISGLAGPRGIVVSSGELWVVNQNVDLPFSGEVLRFDAGTGAFVGPLVSSANRNAPFAPDGLVRGFAGDLFVGNVLRKANSGPPGRVNRYSAGDGSFLGNFKTKNNEHHPRGVVFGPDGLLYVSARDFTTGLGGTVIRFSADGHSEVFIDDKGGTGQLNRPDGLVFGPDGRLYVTSFRAVPGDTDSIRIYETNGAFAGKIDLHNGTTDTRVFAQALLFGPNGELFVPVATAADPTSSAGEVRRYHSPTTGDYSAFVSFESGALLQPLFMTFGKTNPSTLNYDE